MAMIACEECNKEISDTVSKCPYCGYKIKKKASRFSIIAVISIALIILFSYLTEKDDAPKIQPVVYTNAPVPLDKKAHLDNIFVSNNYALLTLSVNAIKERGNRCDAVTTARRSLYDDSIVILCNDLRYEYEMRDIGGKLDFKVIH